MKFGKKLLAGLMTLVMCVGVNVGVNVGVGAVIAEAATPVPVTETDERKINFNDSWKFLLVSSSVVTDTTDRSAVSFADDSWQDVTLPHDWSIYEDYGTGNSRRAQGYLPGGLGWYRKTFTLDSSYADKKVSIMFDGIVQVSEVYINGTKLGTQFLGYNTFDYDITKYIYTDGSTSNTIAVRVKAPGNIQRWYCGAGIYRNTYLIVTEDAYVPTNGIFVTTPQSGLTPAFQSMTPINPTNAVVNVKTEVTNESGSTGAYSVRSTIVNKLGETVADPVSSTAADITNGSTNTVEQNINLPNPKLWSPDSPNLYWLKTEILSGQDVIDEVTTRFGVRYLEFTSNYGFFLNGVRTKLHGMCEHDGQGPLGMEVYQASIDRRIRKLKEMGCNAVRTSHNPFPPEFIEACDRLGMLVFEEAFDQWTTTKNDNDYGNYFAKSTIDGTTTVFTCANTATSITWNRTDLTSNAERDMKAMVDRDKNAPCIFAWSAGNEIEQYGTNAGIPLYKQIREWVREIDTTRPVAAAPPSWSGTYTTQLSNMATAGADIVGFNYKTTQYETVHSTYPNMIIFGSETVSAWYSRGVYHPDSYGSNESSTTSDSQYSEYPFGTHFELDSPSLVRHRPDYNLGEFVWTGHSYLGEPQMQESVGVASYYGVIDTCGFEKDIFYFYKSNWTEIPTVHLLPQNWNWTQGQQIPIMLYTNQPRVEVFLNGVSIYTKNNFDVYSADPAYIECGKFAFQAGELKAVAYDANGNKTCEDVVYTAGAAASVQLTTDRAFIGNDGTDIAYVEATIVDSAGNKVPDAAGQVTFTVTGGEIVAVGNGNPIDTSRFRGVVTRNAFSGKALAIVRPTKGSTADITVTAKYGSGGSNTVTIGSREGASIDGNEIVSTDGTEVTTGVGITPIMPSSIRVTYSSGLLVETAITSWDLSAIDINTVGDYIAYGTVEGVVGEAQCIVHVKAILTVDNVYVTTLPGIAPPLPVFVTINYTDGTVGAARATWADVDPAKYAAAGSTFDVEGSLGSITVTAHVSVKAFDYAEDVSINAVVGQMPTFPDGVTVHFTDGTTDTISVTWNVPSDLVAVPGKVDVTGAILGSATQTAVCHVHVQYVIYLSDLDWSSYTGTLPTEDKTIMGESIIARNHQSGPVTEYAKGVSTLAPTSVTYNISDIGFVRFTAYVSLDDYYSHFQDGAVVFKVYLDGYLAYTSGVMDYDSEHELIDLDVTGVKEFKIVAEVSGNAPAEYNIGNWADAKFFSDESQEPVNLQSQYYIRKGMPGDLPNVLINPTINAVKYYGKVYLSYDNPSVSTVNLLGTTITATATLPVGSTTTMSVPVVIVPRYLKYFYNPGDTSTAFSDITAVVNQNGWTMANTVGWPTNVATGTNAGWYASSGSNTTCNAVGTTTGTGISGTNDLFTSMVWTDVNSTKIGFNFLGLTNGASYNVYSGTYNSWSSRTVSIYSNTAVSTGALGTPPYNTSTGTSQGTVTSYTTKRVNNFSVTATSSQQLRVGYYISGGQACVSFVMLEQNTTPAAYTATLVKPAVGVTSYSAPYASATTKSVNSGDRLFFDITLEAGYDLTGASATNGATATVVGSQIVVTDITANTTITLDVTARASAMINAFDFPTVTGTIVFIDQTAHTIDVTVPYGTDVTALNPTVNYVGDRYTPEGAQNFTAPKTYTVYPDSSDGDSVEYVVTVTVAPASGAKDITAFIFGGATGLISGNTITVYVLKVTSLTGVPAVTVSQFASCTPTGTQTFDEGVPVTYTVTAQDGTTKDYAVTVNFLPDTNLNRAIYVQDAQKAKIIESLPPAIAIDDGSGSLIAGTVSWTTSGIPDQSYAYETIEVPGTFTAYTTGAVQAVTSYIEVVPRGLMYYIDSNSMVDAADGRKAAGSLAYDSAKALEPDLLNETADKSKGTGTWGYTTSTGTSGNTMRSGIDEDLSWYKVENYTDKYNYGWYSHSSYAVTLSYDLSLPAGSYMITTGIQEFWPSSNSHTRSYTVTVSNGGTTLASVSNTLLTAASQYPGARQADTLFFTLDSDATIAVSMARSSDSTGEQPQISWIAVAKQGVYATVLSADTATGLKTTTLVENYTPNAISGSGILAVYGAGKLTGVNSAAFVGFNPYSSDGKGVLSIVNNITSVPAVYEAKLYIWDTSYVPLCEAKTVT